MRAPLASNVIRWIRWWRSSGAHTWAKIQVTLAGGKAGRLGESTAWHNQRISRKM